MWSLESFYSPLERIFLCSLQTRATHFIGYNCVTALELKVRRKKSFSHCRGKERFFFLTCLACNRDRYMTINTQGQRIRSCIFHFSVWITFTHLQMRRNHTSRCGLAILIAFQSRCVLLASTPRIKHVFFRVHVIYQSTYCIQVKMESPNMAAGQVWNEKTD